LSTSTSNGRAGDISIQATGLVEFVDNDLFSNVLSGAQNGQAGNINIKAGSLSLLNGAQLQSSVDEGGQGNAGNVTIDVPDGTVRIAGRNSRGNPSGIFNNVQSTASGDAGNITINAASIFTDDASLITTNAGTGIAGDITLNARDQISIAESRISARGNQGGIFIGEQLSPASVRIVSTNTNNSLSTSTSNGRAGDISIQATGLVEFDGNNLFSNVLSGAQNGQAGDITIKAGSLSLLNGAQVQSNVDEGGQGNAGNVTLRSENGDISLAGGSIIFSTVESGGTGNAGKIDVTTRNLSLTGGSQLQTLVRAGGQQGNAGNITVQASGTVRIAGRQPGGNCSGIFSEVQSGASGNAGNITINAGSIFTDDALLRARNTGNGSAGNISLQVGDAIAFTNRTEISSSIFGTGNAGNVTLRTENGDISLAGSNIFSTVDSGGMGNAGKIDIITRNLSLTDGSQLQTLVRAGEQSNAGNITVQASGTVRIAGRQPGGNRSGIFSEVQSGASGNAGNITINASSIFTDDALLRARNAGTGSAGDISLQVGDAIAFTNRTEISSSISGTGNAGNVTLRTENGDISLAGRSLIFSTVESGGTGNAGKIDVTTGNLTLTDGSQLQTLVRARQQGNADNITANAGNITVQASGTVRIAGRDSSQENPNPSGIFSTLGSGVSGDGGNITINAGSIFTDDASLRTTNAGTGSAGSITLNARDQVSILNSRVFSDGDSGFIFIGRQSGTTDNLSLIPNRINIDNSTVSATNNSSSGIAGDIALNARDQVSLNQSTIRSNGNRGRIFIGKNDIYGDRTSSPRVIKLEGSFLNTTNQNITGARNTPFNAGDISIDAIDSISLNNQSFIQAFTERRGDAGNVTLRAENGDISLAGGSDIFSTVESGGTGNAGAIDVTTRNLTLTDGAQLQTLVRAGQRGNAGNITVQASGTVRIAGRNSQGNRNYSGIFVTSTGTGQGGNLSITGNSLTLDRGILSASTASADGGNINLRLRNFLRLQNESLISANAGGQQNGGNGGNIAIDTPFIVAFPQNNDITANAVSGSGGQVRTNATLFGIVPRTRADLERLGVPSLNPRNLPTSDITAFSQQNSSFGDNVQVTSPDVDPSRGLVELPETVTDRTQQIAQSPCQQGFGNEFVVTGRGGLPTTPNQTLSSDNVRVDLLQPVASSGNSRSATIKPATNSTATRVPAQGWIFNDKGQVVLTAYDPTNTGSQRSWRSAAACPAR
jgi:large exoprotein involved in heme utilization and adhesion